MNVALAKTETERAVNSVFAVARERLPGSGKVAEARRQAFDAFERAGLPNRRIEEWKYTDLRALMREVLPLAPTPDAAAIKRARAALKTAGVKRATRLVLVDGVFVPQLSDAADAGINVKTLREALEGGDRSLLTTEPSDAMIALNAAMAIAQQLHRVGKIACRLGADCDWHEKLLQSSAASPHFAAVC